MENPSFPLCLGSNPINYFISVLFFSFLLYNIFICILYSFLENSFNIYTKCSLNGTLANTKMHIQYATESVNSIGYGLFAVIKTLFSNQNDLDLMMNFIRTILSIKK